MRQASKRLTLFTLSVLLISCIVIYFRPYSIQQKEGLRLDKIDISTFADTDEINVRDRELEGVYFYQDCLVYLNNDQLWKVDPFTKKAINIELNPINYHDEIYGLLDYEIDTLYGEYAVIKVTGDLDHSISYNNNDYETHVKKYYFGLVNLRTEEQVGAYIEFDSQGSKSTFKSEKLYIQGKRLPTGPHLREDKLHSFILQIDTNSNKVTKEFENNAEHEQLYQELFEFKKVNKTNSDRSLSSNGSKQIINNDTGYSIKNLVTNEEKKYSYPDVDSYSMNAYFGYSDKWIIEEIITETFPYTSAEVAKNPDAEYETIPEYEYYLRDLNTNRRKRINFEKDGPFFKGRGYIRKKDHILWLSEGKIIKESIKDSKIIREYYLINDTTVLKLINKSMNKVHILAYDKKTSKLFVFALK